jgi:8-oxo-dGTP pyrophosphatase MutT (NUDIX family)
MAITDLLRLLPGDWYSDRRRGIGMQENHVVTCFVENEGLVLIVKRSSRVGTYQQRWAGISGYLEKGNTALEQAREELAEEAGLSPDDATLVKEGAVLEVRDEELGRIWYIHPFRFALDKKDKIRLDWENTEHIWINPEEIPACQTVPGLYEAWLRVK